MEHREYDKKRYKKNIERNRVLKASIVINKQSNFNIVPSCTKMLTHGRNIMTLTFYVRNLIQFVFQLVTSFEFM